MGIQTVVSLTGAPLLAVAVAAGCQFDRAGFVDSDGGEIADGPVDASPFDAMGCPGEGLTMTPSNFDRCDIPGAGPAMNIATGTTWTLSTDTGIVTASDGSSFAVPFRLFDQPGGPEIMIATTTVLTVDGRLDVVGTRPLAVVSYSDVVVSGTVFAGGVATLAGPGADDSAQCATGLGSAGSAQATGPGIEGGSGGAGGGYGRPGGDGARVDSSGGPDNPGGMRSGVPEILPLRGGCSGGNGGLPTGGQGGGGGGGLQFVAEGNLTLATTGRITASGAGGQGTSGSRSGGAGGGSGGALLLEGQQVIIAGHLTALGGGGSAGTRNTSVSGAGESGHIDDSSAATGAAGQSNGGSGGDGGTGLVPASAGQQGISNTDAAGGGGGGGSAGRIRLNSAGGAPVVTGVVAPPRG